MNAVTPEMQPDFHAGPGSIGPADMAGADVTAMRWQALSEAGRVVGMLAGADETPRAAAGPIEDLLARAQPWRRALAITTIADLAAMLEPGIATLLEVNGAGADPRVAARALWREYLTTREAVLDLLDQDS